MDTMFGWLRRPAVSASRKKRSFTSCNSSGSNSCAIKNTVLIHLQQMPWYTSLERSPQFQQQFQQGFDQFWRVFGSFILPDPFSPAVLAGILTTPALLALGWIV